MNAPDPDIFDKSFVFAYDQRMYPYFHQDHLGDYKKADPFDGAYFIPKDVVAKIITHCDEEWRKKNPVTFYGLEDQGFARSTLISVLRYAFLNNRFDDDFYKSIESNCPCEAHGLTEPYTIDQVYI
jgi:hypothetical protein